MAVQLDGVGHLVLAGAREPVTPFAYPGRSSILTPDRARVHRLGEDPGADVLAALLQLADRVAAGVQPVLARPTQQALPSGPLTDITWAQVIGALLPAKAIICDESITAGMASLPPATAGAAPHDVLGLVGLAIGQGLPLAIGAATACPERPVICLGMH